MKVDSIEQYVNTLHQLHQEIEKDPTNQKVTDAIAQFLDDNSEYLTDRTEITTELASIGVVIQNSSVDNPLINKIRRCVRQILPDEGQSRNHSLAKLRSNGGGIRQIAEWIDLADIPVDELPLTIEEQLGILGRKLKDHAIPLKIDGESLAQITQQLLKIHGKLNDNEKKIVISLAKYCAQQDAGKIAENVKKFGIQNQDTLVEIAKLCAQNNGWKTSQFIKNFGIEVQEDLVEIAKLCARQNESGTARHIKNFGIKQQGALVEIAKLCVKGYGAGPTAHSIKKFGIEAQEDLVEIAKLCAQQNGGVTAYNIENFGIQNQTILEEIAKLCAQKDGGGTAFAIKNFGIQNPAVLVEIAKFCAQQDGAGTSQFIQNFGIQNPEVLVEIAKLCAQQNGGGTAEVIQKFGIQNQKILVEIAKLCAQRDGAGTAQFIQRFNIKDGQDRFRIFIECVKQSEATLPFAKNFVPFPELFYNVFECISAFENNRMVDQGRSELIEAFHKTITGLECSEVHKVEFQTLGNKILELDSFQYSVKMRWFLRCLALITTLDQKAVEWTLEKGLLSDLSELRDPDLRQQLSVGLFALVESEEGRKRWNEFLSQMSPKKGLRLLAIPLFNLKRRESLQRISVKGSKRH